MTDNTTGNEPGEGDAATYHHPAHYNAHPSGVECIDIVRHMSFNVGSAIKYLWRADEKGAPVEDLEKARWYITDEIERRKKQVLKVAGYTGEGTPHWRITPNERTPQAESSIYLDTKTVCVCEVGRSHFTDGGLVPDDYWLWHRLRGPQWAEDNENGVLDERFMRRTRRLFKRGLSRRLMQDLRMGGNVKLLAEIEALTDDQLRVISSIYAPNCICRLDRAHRYREDCPVHGEGAKADD